MMKPPTPFVSFEY